MEKKIAKETWLVLLLPLIHYCSIIKVITLHASIHVYKSELSWFGWMVPRDNMGEQNDATFLCQRIKYTPIKSTKHRHMNRILSFDCDFVSKVRQQLKPDRSRYRIPWCERTFEWHKARVRGASHVCDFTCVCSSDELMWL